MKKRKNRPVAVTAFLMAALFLCLTGCAKANSAAPDKTAFVVDITSLTVDESVRIVGLGEASHGTSEFQQLKGDVFKALVTNNHCRVFAIEGDFGGCALVNEYIHGGGGTAEEAAAKIGFRIYRTQEIVALVEWMRAYNETAPDGEDLKFYGFDSQRYDNNKALLFEYLEKTIPSLAQEYSSKFSALTDENMYSIGNSILAQAKEDVTTLMDEMNIQKPPGMNAAEQFQFDMAREYAQTILENTRLQGENSGYNKVRDSIMARKVEWIAEQEDGLIFINGHNGHIGRQSVSGYTCMGELLNEAYGEAYFPIGTDALNTVFNAYNNGEYKQFTVSNSNAFTDRLDGLDGNLYYLDFSGVEQDEDWLDVLKTPQTMAALNAEFSNWQKVIKMFYTLEVTPLEAYAGIIVLADTNATHLLD